MTRPEGPNIARINPMLLPWNHEPTAQGEQEVWEELRHDLIDAWEAGAVTGVEGYWYLLLMAEMFTGGGGAMRTPIHVLVARFCFLHFESGEA